MSRIGSIGSLGTDPLRALNRLTQLGQALAAVDVLPQTSFNGWRRLDGSSCFRSSGVLSLLKSAAIRF